MRKTLFIYILLTGICFFNMHYLLRSNRVGNNQEKKNMNEKYRSKNDVIGFFVAESARMLLQMLLLLLVGVVAMVIVPGRIFVALVHGRSEIHIRRIFVLICRSTRNADASI